MTMLHGRELRDRYSPRAKRLFRAVRRKQGPHRKKAPISGACRRSYRSAFDEILGKGDDATDQLLKLFAHAFCGLAFFLR